MLRLAPSDRAEVAPRWTTSQWFNSDPLGVGDLAGKVVVVHAFQMLCPGCVAHGLPQASRIHETFAADDVCVIGLHTVFEHHEAMTPAALQAFLHEYRVPFPVGVDQPSDGPIPTTMAAYEMRGTPTLVLIDRSGRRRTQVFGRPQDLELGAAIQTLVDESVDAGAGLGCDDRGCLIESG